MELFGDNVLEVALENLKQQLSRDSPISLSWPLKNHCNHQTHSRCSNTFWKQPLVGPTTEPLRLVVRVRSSWWAAMDPVAAVAGCGMWHQQQPKNRGVNQKNENTHELKAHHRSFQQLLGTVFVDGLRYRRGFPPDGGCETWRDGVPVGSGTPEIWWPGDGVFSGEKCHIRGHRILIRRTGDPL